MGIPEGWRQVRLRDLQAPGEYACVGGPFGSSLTSRDYVPDGVPVIRGNNLNYTPGRRFSDDGYVYVSAEKAATLRGNMAFPGDLVFTQRGTLGQVGIVPPRARYPAYVISQSQMKLTPNVAETTADYLYCYFSSSLALKHIENSTLATGIPHINLGILRDFPVPLPPLGEQRKIAAILSSVDEAIEKTQAVIDQVQVVRKGLMQELLTKGLPGRHKKFKQTDLGEIPESWQIRRGEEMFVLAGGYGPSSISFAEDGDAIFVKVNAFSLPGNERGIAGSEESFQTKDNPGIRCFGGGSLVFPKRGAAIFKNRVGLLLRPTAVDPNLMVLTPNQEINVVFLRYHLLHVGLFNISDNSGIPQINNKHLYPALFPIPPRDEQAAIAGALTTMDDRLENETRVQQGQLALKKSLMSTLLTGEVRVTP